MSAIIITIRIDTPEGSTVQMMPGTSPAPSAGAGTSPRPPASAPPPTGPGSGDGSATEKQKKMIYGKAMGKGLTRAQLVTLMQATVGVNHTNELGKANIDPMVTAIGAWAATATTDDIPF